MHKCGAGKQVNDVNFGSAAIKRGCKSSTYQKNVEKKLQFIIVLNLRSKRLEVERVRETGTREGYLPLARPFFLAPTTSKRLLRTLYCALIWGFW